VRMIGAQLTPITLTRCPYLRVSAFGDGAAQGNYLSNRGHSRINQSANNTTVTRRNPGAGCRSRTRDPL